MDTGLENSPQWLAIKHQLVPVEEFAAAFKRQLRQLAIVTGGNFLF